jgi:hypothetical protein
MEKRLEATHGAALAVQPALAKFYNSLSVNKRLRCVRPRARRGEEPCLRADTASRPHLRHLAAITRQLVILGYCPAILDHHVLTFDIARGSAHLAAVFRQGLKKR